MDSHVSQFFMLSYMVCIHGFLQNSPGKPEWILALGCKFLTLNIDHVHISPKTETTYTFQHCLQYKIHNQCSCHTLSQSGIKFCRRGDVIIIVPVHNTLHRRIHGGVSSHSLWVRGKNSQISLFLANFPLISLFRTPVAWACTPVE